MDSENFIFRQKVNFKVQTEFRTKIDTTKEFKKQTRLEASAGKKKMSALVYVYTLIVYLPG
jgi:hypothetical protein